MSWLMGDRGWRNCRWVLAAGKSEFELFGVIGGMTVIVMLACAMMRICGEPTAEQKGK